MPLRKLCIYEHWQAKEFLKENIGVVRLLEQALREGTKAGTDQDLDR